MSEQRKRISPDGVAWADFSCLTDGKRYMLSLTDKKKTTTFVVVFGGDKRDRTADLLNAIQALSQLSYTPRCVPLRTKTIILIPP